MSDDYQKLIKRVFSNTAGEELIDAWDNLLNRRNSYSIGNSPEETAYREGERGFYLHIRAILETNENE